MTIKQKEQEHATIDNLIYIIDKDQCPLSTFMEQVKYEGKDKNYLLEELKKCFTMDDVQRLVNRFI